MSVSDDMPVRDDDRLVGVGVGVRECLLLDRLMAGLVRRLRPITTHSSSALGAGRTSNRQI